VFLALAAVAVAARVLVVVAYRPALMYLGDSAAYLDQAWRGLWPGDWRPSGYPMFLRLIDGQAHLTRLVVVQQAATFAAGTALYAVGLRVLRTSPAAHLRSDASQPARDAGRPWVAACVAAPALVAPWVLDLGQFVLADSLFGTLVTGAVVLLARPGRPAVAGCVAAGALLGTSLVIRTVGYGPLAVGAAVLAVAAVRTTGWRGAPPRVAGFAVAAAVPVLAYSTWSASEGGAFSVSVHSGFFLYGRVAPFADCSALSRADLRTLCDPAPVARRHQPDVYLWSADAPLRQGHRHIPPGREDLAGEFAGQVIRAQPWMLVTTTGGYLAGYFSPTRHENATTSRAATWELPDALSNALPSDDPHSYDGYYVMTERDDRLSGVLAGYSRFAYPPMPLVGGGMVAGVLAAVLARRRRRPGPPRLFWLAAGSGMAVLLLSALTAGFDYRYLGSVIGLLGAAAVVGTASLVRVLRPAGSAGR
jgi:hypothetical protein